LEIGISLVAQGACCAVTHGTSKQHDMIQRIVFIFGSLSPHWQRAADFPSAE